MPRLHLKHGVLQKHLWTRGSMMIKGGDHLLYGAKLGLARKRTKQGEGERGKRNERCPEIGDFGTRTAALRHAGTSRHVARDAWRFTRVYGDGSSGAALEWVSTEGIAPAVHDLRRTAEALVASYIASTVIIFTDVSDLHPRERSRVVAVRPRGHEVCVRGRGW